MLYKQVQIDGFLKNPNTGLKGVLVYGSNVGLVDTTVKSFIKAVSPDIYDPFNVVYLNADAVNEDISLLISEYCAQSLMAARRVIVVKDADNNLTKHLPKILDYNTDSFLVLYAFDLKKNASLVKFATESSNFAIVPCYDDKESDIASAVAAKLKTEGFTIDNGTLQFLCSRLNADRLSSMSEVDKLITYMGEKRNIGIEAVTKAVSDNSSSSSEDFCYFCAGGEAQKALDKYFSLLNEGTEPVSLVRGLTMHFNKLLQVIAKVENGETVDRAIDSLTPKLIYFRKPAFLTQARKWKKSKLLDVLELLQKAEKDCKSTGYPAKEIVSYVTLQISSAYKKLV